LAELRRSCADLLGRAAEAAAVARWLAAARAGRASAAGVALALLASDEFYARATR
jgi:hypothetical protein